MTHNLTRIHKAFGPIVLSALSLFISFLLLQPLALAIDPHFTLHANRSVGKIAFTVMVLWQILLLLTTHGTHLTTYLFTYAIGFLKRPWIIEFLAYFVVFFTLHWLLLGGCLLAGFAQLAHPSQLLSLSLFGKLALGALATFLLAYTEELIFRAAIYGYLAQYFRPLTGALLTSVIFSLSHNMRNPLALVTSQWQLGLGLFLLGLFLNLVFIKTQKLFTSMGIHAGLVFVKVVLRRIPFIVCPVPYAIGGLLAADLREAFIVHLLLAAAIGGLIFYGYKTLCTHGCPTHALE